MWHVADRAPPAEGAFRFDPFVVYRTQAHLETVAAQGRYTEWQVGTGAVLTKCACCETAPCLQLGLRVFDIAACGFLALGSAAEQLARLLVYPRWSVPSR